MTYTTLLSHHPYQCLGSRSECCMPRHTRLPTHHTTQYGIKRFNFLWDSDFPHKTELQFGDLCCGLCLRETNSDYGGELRGCQLYTVMQIFNMCSESKSKCLTYSRSFKQLDPLFFNILRCKGLHVCLSLGLYGNSCNLVTTFLDLFSSLHVLVYNTKYYNADLHCEWTPQHTTPGETAGRMFGR